MKSLTVGDHGPRLRYLDLAGDGIPLLMVHGLGCAGSHDDPHVARAPALAGRRVVVLDLLGFGYSDRPSGFGYRVEDHAGTVTALADALGLERLDLYGHSMGGSVAIAAAGRLGGRVAALVVSEANLDAGGGPGSRRIAAWSPGDYAARGHAETVAAAEASGNAGWAATMRMSAAEAVHGGAVSLVEGGRPAWRELLYRHPSRRSFIVGARSMPYPGREALAGNGVAVPVVADAGHNMALQNPEGLAAAVAQATLQR